MAAAAGRGNSPAGRCVIGDPRRARKRLDAREWTWQKLDRSPATRHAHGLPNRLSVAGSEQGFIAGGCAGAVSQVSEHSPPDERSPPFGWMPAATRGSFSAAALLVWALTLEQVDTWGWRVTFLLA